MGNGPEIGLFGQNVGVVESLNGATQFMVSFEQVSVDPENRGKSLVVRHEVEIPVELGPVRWGLVFARGVFVSWRRADHVVVDLDGRSSSEALGRLKKTEGSDFERHTFDRRRFNPGPATGSTFGSGLSE